MSITATLWELLTDWGPFFLLLCTLWNHHKKVDQQMELIGGRIASIEFAMQSLVHSDVRLVRKELEAIKEFLTSHKTNPLSYRAETTETALRK